MLTFLEQSGLSFVSPGGPLEAVRRAGTAGEEVSFALALSSDRDVDDVTVVPPDGVDLWVVHGRAQPGSGLERSATRVVPELLLRDDREPLRDGFGRWCGHFSHLPRRLLRQRRVFYRPPRLTLTGSVRTSLRAGRPKPLLGRARLGAGTVRGEIAVRRGSAVIGSLSLEIELLPFRLLEPPQERFLWYRGTLDCTVAQHAVAERVLREQLATIRAAGFTSISLGDRDASRLDRAVAIAREVGFRGDLVLHLPLPLRLDRVDFSGFSPILYVADEPDLDPPRRLGAVRSGVALARRAGFRSMVSVVDGSFARVLSGEGVDRVDVYFPRNRRLESGRAYYWQAHLEKPEVHRALAGLALWKSGARGISPYCFQHRPVPPVSPYDDEATWEPAHPAMRSHMATYPARGGTVPTLQWVGLAEGIADLRWLATVEAFVAAAGAKSSPEARSRAEEAASRLRSLAGRIDLERLEVLSSRTDLPWADADSSMLDHVRRDLVKVARELHEVMADG